MKSMNSVKTRQTAMISARACTRQVQRYPELSMSKCQSFKIQILQCAKTRVGMLNSRRLLQTNKPGDPHFFIFPNFFPYSEEISDKI